MLKMLRKDDLYIRHTKVTSHNGDTQVYIYQISSSSMKIVT